MKIERREKGNRCYFYLDVTKYIKFIFGNFVRKAEVEIPDYDGEEEAKRRAKEIIRDIEKNPDVFDLGDDRVLIYFTNGRVISAWASEWGDIAKVCEETKYEGDSFENMSDDELRKIYLIVSEAVEEGLIEVSDSKIMTMAYLKCDDNTDNALAVFYENIKKEIMDRWLYLN